MTRPAIERLRALLADLRDFVDVEADCIFESSTDESNNFPDKADQDEYDAMLLLISRIDEITPELPALLAAERGEKLELALKFIQVGVLNGHIKSKPIMPPFSDEAESIEFIGLAEYIDAALARKEG